MLTAQKCFVLLFACLLIIAPISPTLNAVEATQVLTLHKNRYLKTGAYYSSLGLVCECCDGEGGKCKSTWEAACSNLRCHPWKY